MLLEKKIPPGYFLRTVRIELPVVVLLSFAVNYVTQHFRNFLPEMPLSIPAFLGTAISIQLDNTLAIALKDVGAIFEIPLLILISVCFFLLEKTAYQLKDPFRNRPSDTSVTAIARTIEINIRQLLGETEVPAPVAPEAFYIM